MRERISPEMGPSMGWVGSKFWQRIWIGFDRLNHVNFTNVIAVAMSVAVWARIFVL